MRTSMAKKNKVRRWFKRLKGNEFIQSDRESVDVFVHYSVEDGNAYGGLYEEYDSKRSSRSRRRR